MKKVIFLFVILFAWTAAFADTTATCKVKDSTDNATVVATIGDYDKAKQEQIITVSNDGEKPVNVTFTVSFNDASQQKRTVLAYPWKTTTVTLKSSDSANSIVIEGARCK